MEEEINANVNSFIRLMYTHSSFIYLDVLHGAQFPEAHIDRLKKKSDPITCSLANAMNEGGSEYDNVLRQVKARASGGIRLLCT